MQTSPEPDVLDCLIVGAGPGGLTAATYLRRFHRRIAVVDAGKSRARWIPTSHNCPGFPSGVDGVTLLQRLRAQAERYGARIHAGRIIELQRRDGAFLASDDDGHRWLARNVLLATGIVDRMPQLGGGDMALEAAIAAGTLRLCAVCDGYEASDDRLAVYAPIDDAIRHAVFLRTFSRRVDAIASEPGEPSPECRQLAEQASVAIRSNVRTLRPEGSECVVDFCDGTHARYDSLYPVLGGVSQSLLAASLGADLDSLGELIVDGHQQTNVAGLYAVGDVVSALNQISVAVGHAAIAATAIHNRLPRNYRETAGPQAPDPPVASAAAATGDA